MGKDSKKIKIKIPVRYHYTHIRMVKIKKVEQNKNRWSCVKTETLIYYC